MQGIYLARHGETEYNAIRRFQGQLPVPLNDRGRAQAAELAERAANVGFVALWTSPLRRARETADIVGARIGLEPLQDARLMETDAGDWTDRTFADVQAEAPEAFRRFVEGDPDFAFPGGESFVQQGERVVAALQDIARGPRPTLVVCHGVAIRLALARLRGQPPLQRQAVPNAALIPVDPSDGIPGVTADVKSADGAGAGG
ncbi:MAG TPA: histidine phosphatase family protein [Solirubrobacteraceae bacterium]|nr:histidine phosphatase family protein [Solirubrobacteraceae bacterium]